MEFVLVVTAEPDLARAVREVLAAQGWWVTVVAGREAAMRAAADHEPGLVLIDAALEGASELVRTFGSKNGGPGALVMAPSGEGEDESSTLAVVEAGADQVLSRPPKAEALVEAAGRVLEAPHQSAGGVAANIGKKLTSSEIFGDLVSELEGEAAQAPTEAEPTASIESASEPELPIVTPAEPPVPAASAVTEGIERGESSEIEATAETPVPAPALAQETAPATTQTPGPGVASPDEADEPQEVGGQESGAETPAPAPDVQELAIAGLTVPSEPDSVGTKPRVPDPAATDGALGATAGSDPAAEPGDVEGVSEVQEPVSDAVAGAPVSSSIEGQPFGQYVLHERIAVGGMAEVWRASMLGLEGFRKVVAIKRILPHLAENDDFVRMFIDEAKLAAQLSHENLVDIYDLGKIEGSFFIAMEYVEGRDLRSVLNRLRRGGERMPLGLALLIAGEVADGLAYAHARTGADGQPLGLVHRDVSPRNVLIGWDGRIRLCDFGVAKAVSSVVRTEIGELKGKLQYMSPEQASGRPVDGRSDLYSLGSVLYEMAVGRRLFAADNELSLLDVVRAGKVEDPRRFDPALDPEVAGVLLKSLARERSDRYESAAEFAADLHRLGRRRRPEPSEEALGEFLEDLFRDPLIVAELGASAAPANDVDAGDPDSLSTVAGPSTETLAMRVGRSRALKFWLGVFAGLLAAALVAGALKMALDWAGTGRQPAPTEQEEQAEPGASVLDDEVRRREEALKETMVEDERRAGEDGTAPDS